MTRRAIALALLALGCGSRSGLAETFADVPTGAGGAPTSPCATLSPHGPVITPEGVPSPALDDALRVTAISDDGRRVAAVFARKSPDGVLALEHAALAPWDDWPEIGTLGPIYVSGIQTQSSHAIGQSEGQRWAAAVRADAGVLLYRGIDAEAGGGSEPPIAVPGIDPMFVAADQTANERHLVGSFDLDTPAQVLRATFVGPSGNAKGLTDLGCATGQPPRAAAIGFGDHWLVAASRSTQKSCLGAPTEVAISRVRETSAPVSLGKLTSEDAIVDVQVAAHPDGAFVVYSTAGADGGRIVAARVVDTGGVVAGPTAISPPNLAITAFALGSVGDQLAIAWRKDFDLAVSVFDASFGLRAETVVVSEPSFGPSALFGSPAGEGLVVAWTATPPGDFRVRLARLDCAP